jgi:hypothetical protein
LHIPRPCQDCRFPLSGKYFVQLFFFRNFKFQKVYQKSKQVLLLFNQIMWYRIDSWQKNCIVTYWVPFN